MKPRILLTGAATLVGAEILKELLLLPGVESIFVTIPSEESMRRRDLDRLEAYLGPMPHSFVPLIADLRLPRFGLSPGEWHELAPSVDIAFHCAQRESTDQNLEFARELNLRPVEAWIDFLGCNPKLRLHHLSSGFIAGTRRGLLTEFDVDCGQDFHNAWERSKFEAEVRFRESEVSDRVTIYRPSHTLGRATTGQAFQFGGAYPLISTLAASWILPGDPRARIDLVPADYVAASIVALADSEATGTFHLAGGWERSLEVRKAGAIVAKACGRSRGPRVIPRGFAWPLHLFGTSSQGNLTGRRVAFRTARDLLHQGPVFDTYLADLALGPLGVTPPPDGWLERVVRWADERRWTARPADNFNQPTANALMLIGAESGSQTVPSSPRTTAQFSKGGRPDSPG
jgi:nucleoside-diphosphate-sugar epimerase